MTELLDLVCLIIAVTFLVLSMLVLGGTIHDRRDRRRLHKLTELNCPECGRTFGKEILATISAAMHLWTFDEDGPDPAEDLPGYTDVVTCPHCATVTHFNHDGRVAVFPEGCGQFDFTVQHTFYVRPPVDRVVLVGRVNQGSVKVGEKLIVHGEGGPLKVKVEAIDNRGGEACQAEAGQDVGLQLSGITTSQAVVGTRITRR